ncbi:MAG: hypothetical protein PVJ05_08890 [Candidatus Thorarchaeota archaeon]|jgi:hypothetical protein
MNRRLFVILTITISLTFLVVVADAHIPIVPDDGTTLATATEIIDPWKSWFYYSELNPGSIHYYSFEASAGERIRFMLNVPIPEGNRGFTPNFVLMGPGVTNQGTPPASLEIPGGAGVTVIESSPLEAEYEGFTPLSQYTTVDLNMSAPATGTYYIAIYEETNSGRYALVTGYIEAYSVLQWIMVPSMAITIIMWSGQSLLFILLLMLLPLILGLAFIAVRHRTAFRKERALTLVGTMGGLLFLGSSFSFFSQMMLALLAAPYNWTVIVSILFIAAPLILGVAVLRIVHKEGWESQRSKKIALIVLGIIAPFVWAGLYLGPILVIVAGLTSASTQ